MIKIYSITHKNEKKYAKGRIPLGVGSNKNIINVNIYDNTGDNIADKNKHYCELTALYWIWKNTDDQIVGLEHYRRFLCKERFFYYRPVTKTEIKNLLNKYDIILPRFETLDEGVYSNYAKSHYQSDMDTCGEVIKEKYPEYVDDYEKVMASKRGCFANVFIAKKELADEYCEWIFNILFEVEKRINYLDRDAYQQRVFGFLSERLFNVWLLHKDLKVKYMHMRGFGESGRLFRVLRRIWCKITKKQKA